MSRFIDTDIGLINMDSVWRIHWSFKPKKSRIFMTKESREEFLDCIIYDDRERIAADVISAGPGIIATTVWAVSREDLKARPTGTMISQEPVIAWRIIGDISEPIFLQNPGDNVWAFIQMGDNMYININSDTSVFSNLDEVRSHVLEAAQSEWDQAMEKEIR